MNTTNWILIGIVALGLAGGSWYVLSSHEEAQTGDAMMKDTSAVHEDTMMKDDSPAADVMIKESTTTDVMMSSSTGAMTY